VRLAALGLILFAVYALAPAEGGGAMRAAETLADGGGLERAAELAAPYGVGAPLLLAPAHALGGERVAELLVAGIAAAAFVLAALVARRLAPEPWATGAAALLGLAGTGLATAPDLVAGALLAAGALCALRVRERPRAPTALAGAAALAALPWLGPLYVLAGLPVAWVLVRWEARGPRRVVALLAAEVMLGSLVFAATLGERLYGAPLPDFPPVDVEVGTALRWAPVVALALVAAWLLVRSRREHLARALPARAAAETAAALLLTVAVLALPALAAALPAFAALAAWSLRQGPRALVFPLAALTVAATVAQ
jgi:hypothetical protein